MRSLAHARGFSLIEIMIALVISSLLMAGLVTTFTNANTSYAELTKTSRQIENGRYAVSVLETDLRHAGFYGEYTGRLAVRDPENPPAGLTAPSPCSDEPADFLATLVIPIYGFDGDVAPPVACLPNYKANTDVLVVRRVGTEPWDRATLPLEANTVYFQGWLDAPTAPKGPYLDFGAAAPFDVKFPDGINDVPVRPFIQHVYYIASCRNCSGGGDGIPTLTRLEYTGHSAVGVAKFFAVPLAEGIEDMRIRYGIDNSGLNYGTPYTYKTAKTMALDPDWDNVVTVEVNLLARNNEPTRNYQDKKTYQLGTVAVGPFNDEFRRHAFSQVVRIVNAASKKEDFALNGAGH